MVDFENFDFYGIQIAMNEMGSFRLYTDVMNQEEIPMGHAILDDLIQSVHEQNLHVLNVIVRQNGKIMDSHDFEEEKPQLLWSVSKTFTSMAIGIAMSEGHFKLEDHIIDFFPDQKRSGEAGYRDSVTIHDLLCMGSGHAECPVSKADWEANPNIDITELFFNEPFVFKPGTHFTYDNSATYMLSRIITLTTGLKLDDYLNEKIFKPLDIPKPFWDTCPLGYPMGFSGLYLSAEHLSRFGQLILNKGIWERKQLIPSNYIEKASSVQIRTDDFITDWTTPDHNQGYGYQMWMNSYPGSFRMDGLNGQYVVILPDRQAVITYVSDEPDKMIEILELTWKTLMDKL